MGLFSLVPRPHPARVSLALKAIHAGVGFGSGTETRVCCGVCIAIDIL